MPAMGIYGRKDNIVNPKQGEVLRNEVDKHTVHYFEQSGHFPMLDETEHFLDAVPRIERSMVESDIILLKYWLEVSAEEQQRRLEDRIDDGRKLWKLSPIDLKSYHRWDDYTKARDEMFKASDTSWAPWYVANSEEKRRVRLNVISHLLEHIPYEELPVEDVQLGKRKIGAYKSADYPFKRIPDRYK